MDLIARCFPRVSDRWAKFIFMLLGVGVLVPWNAFISAVPYFQSRICSIPGASERFELWLGLVFNFFSVSSLLLLLAGPWIREQLLSFGIGRRHHHHSTEEHPHPSSKGRSHSFWFVTVPLCGYLAVFVATDVLVAVKNMEASTFLALTFLGLVISSVAGALCQSGILATSSLYPAHIGVNPFVSGQAVGGVAVAVANFLSATMEDPNRFMDQHCTADNTTFPPSGTSSISLMSLEYNDTTSLTESSCPPYDKLDTAVFLYFLVAAVVSLCCIIGFTVIDRHAHQARHSEAYETVEAEAFPGPETSALQEDAFIDEVSSSQHSRTGLEMSPSTSQANIQLDSGVSEPVGLFRTLPSDNEMDDGELRDTEFTATEAPSGVFHLVKGPAFTIFFTFFCTLSLFPSWTSLLRSVHQCKSHLRIANDLFTPMTFVIFNVGDLIGRLLAEKIPANLYKLSRKLVIATCLRCVFFPLLLLGVGGSEDRFPMEIHSDVYSFVVQTLFAISNGTQLVSATDISHNHNLKAADEGGPLAPRYWPHYGGKREVRLLDGTWDYEQLGSIDHPPLFFDSMDPNFNPNSIVTPNKTDIPSCVDNAPPGYLGYRGVTFFRTHFDYDLSQAPARLLFQACSFYCRVWINGIEIGEHMAGGYVAFSLDIPRMTVEKSQTIRRARQTPNTSMSIIGTKTNNELFVLVDNRINSTTAPLHTRGDYWMYSGIMRSVELHAMPSDEDIVWPWRLYVLPQTLSAVQLTLYLTSSDYSGTVSGTLVFDNDNLNRTAIHFSKLANNGIVDLGVFAVPNPRIWSIEDPQLHTVTVEVHGATVTERFGLRLFSIDNATSRITINGEIIKLVGWNHHTQWPETAASPTDQDMDNDIALLKEAGTNFVRGAHYPQDPRWLDRLDEAGFVMWSETLGAGVSVENAMDASFMKHQRQQLNEMLDNALNHPSIALWAFFNEGPSNHPEACVGYETCANIIHQRDPTRLVTWASNRLGGDVCLHAADVVSFNNYPGWYNSENPISFWNHQANYVRNGRYPGSKGKPFIISETGAAGIYEWAHNETADRWTLAYQNQIISQDVEVALENYNISGITLWHFFDFKTYDDTENNTHCDYVPNEYPPICAYINATVGRPGGLNHKGVVDFWRRKKPIYDIVTSMYKNATAR